MGESLTKLLPPTVARKRLFLVVPHETRPVHRQEFRWNVESSRRSRRRYFDWFVEHGASEERCAEKRPDRQCGRQEQGGPNRLWPHASENSEACPPHRHAFYLNGPNGSDIILKFFSF